MTGRKVALGMNMSLDGYGYVCCAAGEGDVEELLVTMDDVVDDR